MNIQTLFIFWLMILGYGELGVFGQKIIETPNIDQLAKEGMIFNQSLFWFPRLCSGSCCFINWSTFR
jgi:arylsulfatase A-like enzyme